MDIIFDINNPIPNATKLISFTGYKDTNQFDYENLPEPFIKDSPIVDTLPLTGLGNDATQWLNFEFTDIFNQKAYTGPICGRNITDQWKKVLGDTEIESGDGTRCRLTKTYVPENKPTHALIAATPGKSIKFSDLDAVPVTYGVGDKYIAFFDTASIFLVSAVTIYQAGLMASSGDMTDKLPSAMITALGGPVQQGRNIEMQDVTWEVSIPTIEECTEYLLTFFSGRVKRTQRPLVSIRLADSYKILSSTVSTNNPSNLLAIDSDGKVVETTVTASCYIYLILKPVLKS
ncbi:TPA: hypothetical protein ACGJ7A_005751 [Pseudomonas aeruginosa]